MATIQESEVLLGLKGGSSLTGASGKQILSDLQGILSSIEKSGAATVKIRADVSSVDTAAASVNTSLQTVVKTVENNLIPMISNTQIGFYGLFGDLVKNLDSIPAKIAAISGALTLNNVGNMPAYAPLSRCA